MYEHLFLVFRRCFPTTSCLIVIFDEDHFLVADLVILDVSNVGTSQHSHFFHVLPWLLHITIF
jgi:hypothetical protein